MDKDIWRTRGSLATYPRYPVSQSPSRHPSTAAAAEFTTTKYHTFIHFLFTLFFFHDGVPGCARSQRRGNLGGTGQVGGQNHLAGPAAAGRCPPFPGCAGTHSIYVFANSIIPVVYPNPPTDAIILIIANSQSSWR